MASRLISRNAAANVAGLFAQIAIAFVLSPFLVHTLGDSKYGIWTVAVAFTGYMNLLDIGLGSAVNRYVSRYLGLKDRRSIDRIVSTALVLFLVMGVFIVSISPLMADLVVAIIRIEPELRDLVHLLIIVVSFDIAIFVVRGLFKSIFAGYQDYVLINTVLILSAIYKAVLFYVFLTWGYDLIAMGVISISANLLSLLAFYLLLRACHPEVRIRFRLTNRESAGSILHFSKFTFVTMLANQLIYYSDAFVIGYFMNAAAITYYAIPWSLAEYAKKITRAMSQIYSPAVSSTDAAGDIDGVRSLYLSGSRYLIIVSNLLAVGVIVLGGAFIAIWMGPRYRELGEAVLIILFVNLFFHGPQQLSYSFLQGLGKQRFYAYASAVVSVCNLMLSIILIQYLGIVGVALGAAIPQIVFNALVVPWLTLSVLQLSFWRYFSETYLKSTMPTLLLVGSLLYVHRFHYPTGYLELLAAACACALLYFLAVYYLVLTPSERRSIIAYLRNKSGPAR